jgi:hypothetical protein
MTLRPPSDDGADSIQRIALDSSIREIVQDELDRREVKPGDKAKHNASSAEDTEDKPPE